MRRFADVHSIPEQEERALLWRMKLQEGRPEYTCRVPGEAGSITMWDNRCVQHSASADFWPHRRLMERLTILDFDESRRTPYYAPWRGAPRRDGSRARAVRARIAPRDPAMSRVA